ncbi:MAG: hypothetical protein IJ419_00040 [Agathobacter sp.]|nr:hypothetical protein [Agathobacter sp.]
MNQNINNTDSNDFKQFRSIEGASQAVSRKKIKAAKVELSKVLKEVLMIANLKPLEQDYVNDIMARNMTDRIGKYTDRHNAIIRDYFIICGILYNHTPSNPENLSSEELDRLLEETDFFFNKNKSN